MKWFYNLKTAYKLALSFGCCLVLTLVIGIAAVTRMAEMDKGTKLIVADSLSSTRVLGALASKVKQHRIYEFRYLMETTRAGKADVEGKMSKNLADIQKELDDYGKIAFQPEDVADYKEMEARWKTYLSRNDEQMELGRRNDQKHSAALLAARRPVFEEATTQIETTADWNEKRGEQLAADSEKIFSSARIVTIAMLSVTLVLGIAMAIVLTQSITSNLSLLSGRLKTLSSLCVNNLDHALKAAAQGDIDITVVTGTPAMELDTRDEFGELAQTFNALLGQIKSNVASFEMMLAGQKEKVEIAATIAAGDLTRVVTPRSEKDLLGHAFVKMTASLSDLVNQVRLSADSIAQSSAEVSAGNEDLSQRTEEQASSLEETASSMEEMTSTVKQNADSARQANQLASQARDVAEKGGSLVKETVASMGEINAASKRIADIITVIDELAFQTNLLALNAAVEAARVGEQGRGFAVVAGEVRALAGRSAIAAKEIKDLVQDSVQKVEQGSSLVTQSGQQLQEIVLSVKKVADIIAEISAASQEQATGIEQVNKAVIQMDQITQQNGALVEEATSASHGMNEEAKELQKVVAQFQLNDSFQRRRGDRDEDGRNSAPSTSEARSDRRSAAKPARVLATGTHGRSSGADAFRRKPAASLQMVRQGEGTFEEF